MCNTTDLGLYSCETSKFFFRCVSRKTVSPLYFLKTEKAPEDRRQCIYIYFAFIVPVEGLCCKPKYRANRIRHFIFVFFFTLPFTLPAVGISLLF